ncbi:hypothetical protein ACN6K5_003609 [Streptomyces violaceoruber]|uniref:hypothetical protein n=1 Tax=Streptomyces violaceoruber TaxID=1935 RepID=UPI00403D4229
MTAEEYEEKRRRLSEDAEDARKVLNRARARYEQITSELQDLRIEWRDQQAADRATEK